MRVDKMKELIGLFLLFSSLLITTAHSAAFKGKAAEKIIIDGKVLHTYFASDSVGADHVLLIVYKKQVFYCVSRKHGSETKLYHRCYNSD
jgi:hypothetical protein